MRKTWILVASLLLVSLSGFSQGARMNIRNNAFVVINNNAVIVLENKSDQALTTSGTGGNIVSEGELNRIDWYIEDTTGNYVVPFTTRAAINGGNETKIPVTLSITGAGTNPGYLSFSTYETVTDLNTAYPTTVTTMDNTSGVDGSLQVVDRFWIIDTNNYALPPVATLALTYDDAANEIAGSNTIDENNLQAQRWNPNTDSWESLVFGTNDATNNIVSGINTAPEFFRVWTLVDNSQPLPVTLTSFDGSCSGREVTLNWTTVSEVNNDYFSIERSVDGVNFETVGTISGAGTSTGVNHYGFTVFTEGTEINYFRLTQVDFDGVREVYPHIVATTCDEPNEWTVVPNPSQGMITILGASDEAASIIDPTGRIIQEGKTNSQMDLSRLPAGWYIARVGGESPAQIRFVIY